MRPMPISQLAEHYAGTGLTRTAIRRAIITREAGIVIVSIFHTPLF